jgi:RNA polymerase sigma factor (sigma-70 family)
VTEPPVSIEELLVHRDWLARLAGDLFGGGRGAQDAVQETWLAAMRRRPTHRAGLKGWLATVLRSRFLNARVADERRRARERVAARRESIEDAGALAERIEMEQTVSRWVLELPEPSRTVVILHYYRGSTPSEIARELGEPPGTVRSRLSRARDLLRTRIRDENRADGLLALGPLLVPWGHRTGATSAGLATTTLITGAIMGAKLKIGIIAACVLLLAGAVVILPDRAEPEFHETVARPDVAEHAPAPDTAVPVTDTPPPPSAPVRETGLEPEEIEKRLDRTIERFELNDVPAMRAIGILAATTNLPVALTADAARLIESRHPVQLWLERPVPAKTALGLVAAISGLEWAVEGRRVILSVAGRNGERSAPMVVPPAVLLDPNAPTGLTVCGRILDAAGRPYPGAILETIDSLRDSTRTAGRADDRGAFEIEIRRPYPRVLARTAGRVASLAHEADGDYGHIVRLELRLRGPAGRLEGRVLDPDGRPVAKAHVQVTSQPGPGSHSERISPDGERRTEIRAWFTKTNDDGRFDVDSLPPGKAWVRAAKSGSRSTWTPVTVTAGETKRIEVALTAPVIVEGTVLRPVR